MRSLIFHMFKFIFTSNFSLALLHNSKLANLHHDFPPFSLFQPDFLISIDNMITNYYLCSNNNNLRASRISKFLREIFMKRTSDSFRNNRLSATNLGRKREFS